MPYLPSFTYLIFHLPPLSGPFRSMIPLSFNSDIYLAIVLSVTSQAILNSSIEIFGFSEIIFRISHALASFFLEFSSINFLIFLRNFYDIFSYLCCLISGIIQIIQSQCKIIISCINGWHLRLIKFSLSLVIRQYFLKSTAHLCPLSDYSQRLFLPQS